jgi:hypothetical protein
MDDAVTHPAISFHGTSACAARNSGDTFFAASPSTCRFLMMAS